MKDLKIYVMEKFRRANCQLLFNRLAIFGLIAWNIALQIQVVHIETLKMDKPVYANVPVEQLEFIDEVIK